MEEKKPARLRFCRKNRTRKIERWQVLSFLMMLYDFCAVCFVWFVALWSRFDFRYSMIPGAYLAAYDKFILPYAAVTILLLLVFRLYRSLWRYASLSEFIRLLTVCVLTSVLHTVGIIVLVHRIPVTYYFAGSVLQLIFTRARRSSAEIAYRNRSFTWKTGTRSMDTCRQIPIDTARGMMSQPYIWGALRTNRESYPNF